MDGLSRQVSIETEGLVENGGAQEQLSENPTFLAQKTRLCMSGAPPLPQVSNPPVLFRYELLPSTEIRML